MEKKTYNGWTNWETWNANLWIDNDWQMSESYACQALDLLGSYEPDDAVDELAEIIESDFNEFMPEVSGFFADMLNGAMREVNWHEIAKHYIDGAVETNALDAEEPDHA